MGQNSSSLRPRTSARGQVGSLLPHVSRGDTGLACGHGEAQAHGADGCILKDPTCSGKSGLPSIQHHLPLNKPLASLRWCVWLGSDSLMAPSSHLSEQLASLTSTQWTHGLTHRHGLDETGTCSLPGSLISLYFT